jgi:hypothetical protein
MKKTIIHLAGCLSLVVLMASCASTIDPRYALSDDEMKTMSQAQFAYTADGAMKGAAIGAGTGALTAALSGGNKKDIQKGALTGGLAGGTVGGIMGFQKGDQAGKNKVQEKRSRQVVEKEIAAKTSNIRRLSSLAERQIRLLRTAQQEGQDPAAIKAQAKRIHSEYSKSLKSNSYSDEYKGMAGDRTLAAQVKKAKDLETTLSKIMQEGNVQKI